MQSESLAVATATCRLTRAIVRKLKKGGTIVSGFNFLKINLRNLNWKDIRKHAAILEFIRRSLTEKKTLVCSKAPTSSPPPLTS